MTDNNDLNNNNKEKIIRYLLWGISIMLVLGILGIVLTWQGKPIIIDFTKPTRITTQALSTTITPTKEIIITNTIIPQTNTPTVSPTLTLTPIPKGPINRKQPIKHTVEAGESIDSIAFYFDLSPETVLWANQILLNDVADLLTVDMILTILPTDGIYYVWQSVDKIDIASSIFNTTPDKVIAWAPNNLSDENQEPTVGQGIMFPDASRPFTRLEIKTLTTSAMGDLKSVYGFGACPGNYEIIEGSGNFFSPVFSTQIIGNAFSSAHPGVDYYADENEIVRASDDGIVLYAGWANGGYGNTIVLDHGNGYQTLYAHLGEVIVNCGQVVAQREPIGVSGLSDQSVANTLHFEIIKNQDYIDPQKLIP